MSIGETLAEQRREAGLTIAQVSNQTRIRETVIRAIERDDFTPCGGNFYARGHIRGIARVVGLDPEPLIRIYDEQHGGAPGATPAAQALEPAMPVRFRERRSPNWSLAMAAALVLVVLYGVVQALDGSGGEGNQSIVQPAARAPESATASASASPSPTPSASQSDSVALAPPTNVTVRIRAKLTTWINVRDSKGKQLFSGLLRRGDVEEWTARKRIRVVLGNAGGVALTVNGKNLGSPGTTGQVLRLSFDPNDPNTA
ncbi:MAG TPA: helix-turn-helix domain-containing protein [Streptosporangiaceae bacterium]|nr:helix-turn-helix domain-containing protein [Streptosporangiaceae bacterium]